MLSRFMNIVPSNIGQDAHFGYSIDIDDDVMKVGASNDQYKNVGSRYIYCHKETAWLQEAKLIVDDSQDKYAVIGDNWYGPN